MILFYHNIDLLNWFPVLKSILLNLSIINTDSDLEGNHFSYLSHCQGKQPHYFPTSYHKPLDIYNTYPKSYGHNSLRIIVLDFSRDNGVIVNIWSFKWAFDLVGILLLHCAACIIDCPFYSLHTHIIPLPL